MRRPWLIAFLTSLLSLGLVSCLNGPNFIAGRDAILFHRAMYAIDQRKFDVVRITLVTLINTYPNSDYSAKAKEILEDPAIACGAPDDIYYFRDGSPVQCSMGSI